MPGYCYHLYAGLEVDDYLWCLLLTYLWLQSDARVLLSPVHRTAGVDYLWCFLLTYLWLQSDARVLLSAVHRTAGVDYLWSLSPTCLWLQSAARVLLSPVHRTEVAGDDWLPATWDAADTPGGALPADQGQAWVVSSVSKSPGRFFV